MFGKDHNSVLAYVFDQDGKYPPPIAISVDPEQVASFLVMTRNASKVVITDVYDGMELCTLPGGYIDRCSDRDFLSKKLLPILIPMQQGKVKPKLLEVLDFVGQDEFIDWYNKRFNTQLVIKKMNARN